MMSAVAAEGWFRDPYGRHEVRWFSEGVPTALVRDGDVEAQDPPDPGEVPGPLVRPDPPTGLGPSDLRRSDEVERGEFHT